MQSFYSVALWFASLDDGDGPDIVIVWTFCAMHFALVGGVFEKEPGVQKVLINQGKTRDSEAPDLVPDKTRSER